MLSRLFLLATGVLLAARCAGAASFSADQPNSPGDQAQVQQQSPAPSGQGQTADTSRQETAPSVQRAAPAGTTWEAGVGSVTVNGAQWTRVCISPDIPIWKFGVGLDLELFLDQQGNISNKGWQFDRDNWYQSITRKIRYLRFGHENDPVFVKLGGLSCVSLGYGFLVDRFTNMLNYPEDKLLGVQVYLNDLGPLGFTLQTMTPDVVEFNQGGGIFAARLAFKPLQTTDVPLLRSMSVGATYATDLNEFAPARKWAFQGDPRNYLSFWQNINTPPSVIDSLVSHDLLDTSIRPDTTYRDSTRRYGLAGLDLSVPIIKSALLNLDIYGQGGMAVASKTSGWGIGGPGARLGAGPLIAQVEYRHTEGKFTPGYFGPYYLDERLQRYPSPITKSQMLDSASLNGIFGLLAFNADNFLTINGSYQYMAGNADSLKDQRFEAHAEIGRAILNRVPKISKVEVYIFKTNIGSTVMSGNSSQVAYDKFFDKTPSLFYGYRLGYVISGGVSIVCDNRYGFQWDSNYHLVPYNNIAIQTAVMF